MSSSGRAAYDLNQLRDLIIHAREFQEQAIRELEELLVNLVGQKLPGRPPCPPDRSQGKVRKALVEEIAQELLLKIIWPKDEDGYSFKLEQMREITSFERWVRTCMNRYYVSESQGFRPLSMHLTGRKEKEITFTAYTAAGRGDDDEDAQLEFADPNAKEPHEVLEEQGPAPMIIVVSLLADVSNWAAAKLAARRSLGREWIARYWLYLRLRLYQALCRAEDVTVRRPLLLGLAAKYVPWDPALNGQHLAADWPTLQDCWDGYDQHAAAAESYSISPLIETVLQYRSLQAANAPPPDPEAERQRIRNQWDQWCSRLRRKLKTVTEDGGPWDDPDEKQRLAIELWKAIVFSKAETTD